MDRDKFLNDLTKLVEGYWDHKAETVNEMIITFRSIANDMEKKMAAPEKEQT